MVFFLFFGCDQSSDTVSSEAVSPDGKGGSMATFILKGNYLYSVDHSKINVFSVLDQENPVKVNDIEAGFNIETLFSMDDYLFLGSRNGMFIYDISENPETPKYIADALHFTACDPVVANQQYAFVTLHTNQVCNQNISVNKLMIYDISTISNLILKAERDLQEPKGLALYGKYLLICDKNDILIFDAENPQQLSLVKTIANVPAIDIIIDNNRVFAFTKTTLHQFMLDSDNIENIQEISTYPL